MDREYIKENHIADRYLRGDLTDEETARFEEYFLSDPDVLDELELTEKLRQGLEDVTTVESVRHPEPESARPWSLFRTPQYAAAATVLLLVSMTVTSLLYQRMEQLEAVSMATEPGSVRLVPLMSVRSSGPSGGINRIETGKDEQLILLVDPGPADYASYRVTVLPGGAGAAAEPVWKQEDVALGYQDMLALAVPYSRLETGAYLLRVEGRRGESAEDRDYEPVSEIGFEVELNR